MLQRWYCRSRKTLLMTPSPKRSALIQLRPRIGRALTTYALKDPVGDSLAKSASHRREEHHVLWPDEKRKGEWPTWWGQTPCVLMARGMEARQKLHVYGCSLALGRHKTEIATSSTSAPLRLPHPGRFSARLNAQLKVLQASRLLVSIWKNLKWRPMTLQNVRDQ